MHNKVFKIPSFNLEISRFINLVSKFPRFLHSYLSTIIITKLSDVHKLKKFTSEIGDTSDSSATGIHVKRFEDKIIIQIFAYAFYTL